jgi:polysaccharide export outer membrane protein
MYDRELAAISGNNYEVIMRQTLLTVVKRLISVLLVTWAFSLAAMSQNATPPKADGYVIGPEDVLSIVVFHEDQLSTKVTVRADGKISLLLLDEIQAAGLKPVELKDRIAQGLKKFLTDPQVFVLPVEIHSQYVYIQGAVARPGSYPMRSSLRVTELLVLAGGLSDFAKSDKIVIVRGQVRFPFNYKTFVDGKDSKQDIQLQSHDMVIVP